MKKVKTIMSFILIISSLFIFSGCSLIGSKVVYVKNGNDKIASRFDYGWILYNKKISIDYDCTIIGEKAFYGEHSIEEIYIPGSIDSIGDSAFESCIGLTSITRYFYVGDIGSRAFYGCGRLKNAPHIGGARIGDFAFHGCSSLTSITIGKNVTSIGECAFSDCSSLKKVYYKGTSHDWNNISIGNDNSYLTSATRYYYSATKPSDSGNYWHYDSDGNVKEW